MKTTARTRNLVIALCAAFVLSFGLFACSGGGADAKKAFVGSWKLTGMVENGEAVSEDDMALMEALGMSVTLTFTDDDNFDLMYFGESEKGTWEAKSASEVSMKVAGETIKGTLKDGKLTLEESGTQLIFEKDSSSSSSSSKS